MLCPELTPYFMTHDDYSRYTIVLLFLGQLKLWTQTMAIWDMWYIDEGFLVWIISLTYLSRESIIWACKPSFIHTCIYHMCNLFTACLFVLKLSTLFSMHAFWFRLSDIHIFTWFWIYCRSFNFLYVTCHCLYLYAWTTSLDHVHVCLICTPLGSIICTRGVASDNPEFSCPDFRARTMVALL